jgi:hypothetical protein
VTVTKMFDPATSLPHLFIAFSYNVTSHGYSTHCGDDLHQSYHIVRSYDDVSWFDLWARVRWQFSDGFVWGC